MAEAKGANPNYTMSANNKHCSTCRTVNYAAPFTTLGVEDFSLKSASIFPNPTKGDFIVKTKTFLTKINVYTQTGTFVKTIDVSNSTENVEVNIKDMETGVYLIELVNDKEKSWKKVILE